MARFSTSTRSAATVSAEPEAVWATLTDPDEIARLTPFLQRVTEHGEHTGARPGRVLREFDRRGGSR